MHCGTGIGKALAKKLASQQLNVVLVALPDALLDQTHIELSQAYPGSTFRKVCWSVAAYDVLVDQHSLHALAEYVDAGWQGTVACCKS